MAIKSEIICDSINQQDCRLTTFILEFPRYLLAELNTHRVFSKNAASSRAIPIEKMIQQVVDNPVMPVHWSKNQSGMSADEELVGKDKEEAQKLWLEGRDAVVDFVKKISKTGLHKQVSNRALETWFYVRVLLSGTDFENFFALRAHKDAHPDFQALAYGMLDNYNRSEPKSLAPGAWHIPFGDKFDMERLQRLPGPMLPDFIRIPLFKMKIATARCARISYLNYEGKDDYDADIKLCDRLFGSIPKHLSPAEHVAMSMDGAAQIGNFRGWQQFRKTVAGENLGDPRVVKKHYNPEAAIAA